MSAQWRIRVRGEQRGTVSVTLLTAAVMALGEQLAEQVRQQTPPADCTSTDPAITGQRTEEAS